MSSSDHHHRTHHSSSHHHRHKSSRKRRKTTNKRLNWKIVILLGGLTAMVGAAFAAYFIQQYRHDPQTHIKKAERLLEEGNYDVAIREYKRAAHYDPGDASILRMWADALEERPPESPKDAVRTTLRIIGLLGRVVQLDPDNDTAARRLMKMLYDYASETHDHNAYKQLYRHANDYVENNPADHAFALKYRALAQARRMQVEDFDAADREAIRQDLEAALAEFPDNGDLRVSLGEWYAREAPRARERGLPGKADEYEKQAVSLLTTYLDKYPFELDIKLRLARTLYAQDKKEQAKRLFAQLEQTLLDEDHPDVTVEAASFVMALDTEPAAAHDGRMTTGGALRALKLLESAYEKHPRKMKIMLSLAMAYKRVGDRRKMVELLEKAYAYEPKAEAGTEAFSAQNLKMVSAAELINGYLVIAEENRGTPRFDSMLEKARGMIQKLKVDMSKTAAVDLLQGKLALLEGNFQQAVSKLERANKKYQGKNAEAIFLSALALKRLGENGAAANRLEGLVEALDGKHKLRPLRVLATVYLDANRLAAAENAVDGILDISTENEDAMIIKSEVLRRQYQKAEASLERGSALQLNEARDLVKPLADDGNRKAVLQLARIYKTGDETEKARKVLEETWNSDRKNLGLLQQLLRLDLSAGRKETALNRVDSLLEEDPGNDALKLLKQQISGEGDPVATLEQLLSKREGSLETSLSLYSLYKRTGQTEKAEEAFSEAEGKEPDNPNVMAVRFREALQGEDWAEASKIVEKAEQLNIDNAKGLFWRGRMQMVRGDYSRAASSLRLGLNHRPLYSDGWRMLGDAHRMNGDLGKAEKAYQEAISIQADNLAAYYNLFLVHRQNGLYKMARQDLEKARDIAPGNKRILNTYLAFLANRDKQAAIALREKLASKEPENDANLRRLAMLYKEVGRNDEARVILEKLLKKHPDSLANVAAMADYERNQGEFAEGRRRLETYVNKKGDDARLADWLVLARYLASGDLLQPAITCYKKAIELEDPVQKQATRELADWYFNNQYFSKALELYAQAFEKSKAPNLWLRYVDTLLYNQEFAKGDKLLRAYTRKHGHNAQSSLLECMLAVEQKETRRAHKAAERAVELNPNNPQAYLYRARLKLLEDIEANLSDITRDLKKALSLNPALTSAREMLVQCYLTSGKPQDLDDAAEQLKKIIESKPSYEPARRRLLSIYQEQNNDAGMKELLDDSVNTIPDNTAWRVMRATYNIGQDKPEQAIGDLRIAFEKEQRPNTLAMLGQLLVRQNRAEEAVDLLEKWSTALGGGPRLLAAKAAAYSAQGEEEKAIRAFEQARKSVENTAQLQNVVSVLREALTTQQTIGLLKRWQADDRSGMVNLLLGRIFLDTGNAAEARRYFEACRKGLDDSNENREAILHTIAMNYQVDLKDYTAAAEVYREILRQDEKDFVALNNISFLYSEKLGKPEEAVTYAERARDHMPTNDPQQVANVLDTLGWAQFKANRLNAAKLTLRESIRKAPSMNNRMHLAKVLFAKGESESARAQLRMVRRQAARSGAKELEKQAEEMLAN